ncbi:hypothetical protein HY498_01865 [Candidatus Woesearchaeota archaeon]|nr:hypothetical protein [Candidatus Woesearchaeota archaeon]
MFNSKFGKGFIYSLDAVVAIILVTAVIAAFSLSIENRLNPNSIILKKISADLINVLNEKGSFQNLDTQYIDSEIKNVLPKNYKFEYEITTKNGAVSGGDSKDNEDFYSGFAVIYTNEGFGVMRYTTWQKE